MKSCVLLQFNYIYDITVSWNKSAHKNRDVMGNRADRIIKNKTEGNMNTGRCANNADGDVTQKMKKSHYCARVYV